MQSPSGELLTNEIDRPLMMLSNLILAVRSSSILKAVSMVHECSNTCQFVTVPFPSNIERERVSMSRLQYKHDYSENNMYCLNIYCMDCI